MKNKIDIYLTIDLECMRDCYDFEKAIYGTCGKETTQYGLNFILKLLRENDLVATFFVEPFFSYKFGKDVLKEICSKIQHCQQDIQLHLHPYFKSTGNIIFNDKLCDYCLDEQIALINEGKMILQDCCNSDISCFRAGQFAANNHTYLALKKCNISISSNYNLNYLSKTCKISNLGLLNEPVFLNNGILECPVTNFYEYNLVNLRRLQPKHLQIGAVSYRELNYMLDYSKRVAPKIMHILFHSHEFLFLKGRSASRIRPNKINIERFVKLCNFLRVNKDSFETKKLSHVTLNKGNIRSQRRESTLIPAMPLHLTFLGKLEQLRKRLTP